MSVTLVVNNIEYQYPSPGTQPPWGQDATDWASEVTRVLNSLKGSADILETGANILNNVTSLTDVTDMKFDANIVRSFTIRGNITRVYDSSSIYEEFVLTGLKKASTWILQQDGIGNAGIDFTITPAGQIQYTSSNLTYSTTYSGLLKFRAISILSE
jgi:hypothetical protein